MIRLKILGQPSIGAPLATIIHNAVKLCKILQMGLVGMGLFSSSYEKEDKRYNELIRALKKPIEERTLY